jgi:hypothetical protein
MGGAPVNSHHQGTNRAWARGGGGRTGSCRPRGQRRLILQSPCTKANRALASNPGARGGQEIRPAARSQSQKARGGTKVVPWRRASGRAPEWPENRVHAAPGATGVPMVRGETGLDRTRHHPRDKKRSTSTPLVDRRRRRRDRNRASCPRSVGVGGKQVRGRRQVGVHLSPGLEVVHTSGHEWARQ